MEKIVRAELQTDSRQGDFSRSSVREQRDALRDSHGSLGWSQIRDVWARWAPRPIWWVISIAAAGVVFLATKSPLFPGDEVLITRFQDLYNPIWHLAMIAVTDVGGGWVAMVAAGLLGVGYLLRRKFVVAASFFGVFTVTIIVPFIKDAVERQRPPDSLVEHWAHFSGASFPSGHTVLAAVFYGLLFYLAPYLVKEKKSYWRFESCQWSLCS